MTGINVNVDEFTLNTVVEEVTRQDEYGDPYKTGEQRTIADIVAAEIVNRLTADKSWHDRRQDVAKIRSEIIREQITPAVAEAIKSPVRRTNGYGEPVGEPVTFREVIVDEARKMLNERTYSSSPETILQSTVRSQVKQALSEEIKAAVKQAKDEFAGEIGKHVTAAVKAALNAR